MYETSEFILLGASIIDPEADQNDQEDSDYIANEAIFESRSVDILDSIGSYEFKNIYRTLINDIKLQIFDDQKIFFNSVLAKISEVYDFEFSVKVDIYDIEELNNLYSFLEFIEYNNIDFITSVWKFLDVDLSKINIEKYCLKNKELIIKEIDEQIETNLLDEKSILFLRTYYKIDEWFFNNSEKSKIEILTNLI